MIQESTNRATSPYYLTARQAADALGVTRATLYAYVSRGQVRSEPAPGRDRERRYVREDIERLRERRTVRRDPTQAAARGLHWGGAVLESALTLVDRGRLFYRGRDAVALAEGASLEDVAAILWDAGDEERGRLFAQACPLSARQLVLVRSAASDPLTRIQTALPMAATSDAAGGDLRPLAVRQTAGRILQLVKAVLLEKRPSAPMHDVLRRAWSVKSEVAGDAIRMALVLCADHELNVSAFTARCAASAGASPYDVMSAALASFKGFRHGGASNRVLALLDEAVTLSAARAALAERLRRGETVSGFGHPLYPAGDPRAERLLRAARASGNESALRAVRNLSRAGLAVLREQPNIDFALAAVTTAYRLPRSAPVVLFAVGRTVGWMAHAMEEYGSGQLIRPRARYVGPPPAEP